MRRLLLLAALVAAFVFLAPLIAHAHSWYTQKHDPQTGVGCCGGSDCAPLVLQPGMLTGEVNGYRLRMTLEQARHVNINRLDPLDIFIPFDRVQPSEDGNYHLCIPTYNGSTRGDFYCFFAPPNS